ncbi:acyl-CoA dehydrogenase family protein [Acetobacter pasteurianus]|uniref:Acyl-CoA dehydrogenase n=1 Tax=Acetobacter pasteurianus NBRC 3188 TaxID=1226663 RepID=A0A401WTE7_ACEPA|nr:acyl-CoA dehydrogenase family protein [Acetobacter pasteurianus]GCD52570.1 acyl-CoA dehydrogenase [Acetobacter pasteurianus NBRC 3188]
MSIDLHTAHDAIEAASHLKQQLASRAAHHDRTGIFAQENIDDLRQAGLLSLRISTPERPTPFTLGVVQDIVGQIAQGDASTALVMVNHYMVRAAIAHHEFGSGDMPRWIEDTQHDKLLNILLAEPDLGSASQGGLSGTVATRTATGWVLTGRKAYATGIPGLSWLLVRARTDDNPAQVGTFLVPAKADGIRVIENWDHIGMRASNSHEVTFTDVTLPPDAALELHAPDARPSGRNILIAWNTGLLGALYNGVATSALAWFCKFLKNRVPSNLGAPLATLPSMRDAVGGFTITLHMNAMLLRLYATDVDAARPSDELKAHAAVIKTRVVDAAADFTSALLGLAGNAGLSAHNPLERAHRDALCGRIHAPHAELLRRIAGQHALS